MKLIKKVPLLIIVFLSAMPLLAQNDAQRIVAGAENQLSQLLNHPAMTKPAVAEPLGRNWFRLETDAHVFTDEVSLEQVKTVLLDINNYNVYFDGRRSKLQVHGINRTANESIVDFISIMTAGPLQLRTPYNASVTTVMNTDTRLGINVRQTPHDNNSNSKIKNLLAQRYAEEVTIGGKKYVYIRFYTINDVDASILPGARGVLERNSAPVNQEAIQLLINAAKTK